MENGIFPISYLIIGNGDENKKKHSSKTLEVGNKVKFNIKDCGSIYLKSDEQVTFKCEKGSEYDVTKKEWGYYATPSLNGRLKKLWLKRSFDN